MSSITECYLDAATVGCVCAAAQACVPCACVLDRRIANCCGVYLLAIQISSHPSQGRLNLDKSMEGRNGRGIQLAAEAFRTILSVREVIQSSCCPPPAQQMV